MQITYLSESGRKEWNEFVARQPSFGLLQSWEWGEFKKRMGWQAIRLGVEHQGQLVAGTQVLLKSSPLRLVSMAYVPRGPLTIWKDRETTILLFQAIHQTARQHGAIFLKIEPPLEHSQAAHRWVQDHGFIPSRYANQPRCTLILDLAPDLDEIFRKLSKSTRKKIRAAQRKEVDVRVGNQEALNTFYRIMQATGKRAGFLVRPGKYYAREFEVFSEVGQIRLSLAMHNGQATAVETSLFFGDKAASFHSGFLADYRHLKVNHLLLWQAICWAKEQGCSSFDLWGIPDEVGTLIGSGEPVPRDRYDGLWGVYQFKRAFTNQVAYYVGAYDYVYNPLLYRAITLAISHLGSVSRITRLIDRLL